MRLNKSTAPYGYIRMSLPLTSVSVVLLAPVPGTGLVTGSLLPWGSILSFLNGTGYRLHCCLR